MLLNPDTFLIEDSLEILVSRLIALPGAGAVGCRLLNADRSIQATSVLAFPTVLNRTLDSEFLRRRFPRSKLWGMAALYTDSVEPTEVEAISGACILIKRESFEFVGGFTESYFMYGEDVDLCYKLRRANWKVFHIPNTCIVHLGSGSSRQASSNFSTVMMRESWCQFMTSHRGRLTAITFRVCTGIFALARLILIPPLLIFGTRIVRHGTDSLRKWFAVLLWSIGLARLARG